MSGHQQSRRSSFIEAAPPFVTPQQPHPGRNTAVTADGHDATSTTDTLVAATTGVKHSRESANHHTRAPSTTITTTTTTTTLHPETPSNNTKPPKSNSLRFHFNGAMDPTELVDDKDGGRCYEDCQIDPPITLDSLSELDTSHIVNNPKLRHDVNHDRELHFRPNLDGDRGQQKKSANEDYWTAVTYELCIIQAIQEKRADPAEAHRDHHWRAVLRDCKKRLPKILAAVRDILKSLVPEADQSAVQDRLDVEFLIHEIDNGVCDLVKLADWLARVIKTHCAPMRDSLVDTMQQDVTQAALRSDPPKLSDGLRQLVSILENMKIDVANHQVRHIRPLLINDTVNFLQRYHRHRMDLGKLETEGARQWLYREMDELAFIPDRQLSPLDVVASALLKQLISNAPNSSFPSTFYLDNDRLKLLRAEFHGYIYQQICLDVFNTFTSRMSKAKFMRMRLKLHKALVSIVGPQARFVENIEHIAVEITRTVLEADRRRDLCDTTLTSKAEYLLRRDLNKHSAAFKSHARILHDRLAPKLQTSVRDHSKMTALELHETLLPPLPVSSPHHATGYGAVLEPVRTPTSTDSDWPVIRRLTHIIVLHWQTWAEIVYLAPAGQETAHDVAETQASHPALPTSPSPSPTTALFAADCQFVVPPKHQNALPNNGMPTPSPSPPPPAPSPENERGDGNSEQSEQAPGNHSSLSPD